MKATIYCIFLLILSVIGNKSLFVKADADRIVREAKFEKGQYYDVLEYEWDITPTHDVGIYEYSVSSNHTLYTLLMNSTDFYNWEHTYFQQWLINDDYNFDFLNKDLKSKMCLSPVSTCKNDNINFPYKKLYVVILRTPQFEESSYIVKDSINSINSSKSAKLINDPLSTTTANSIRSTTIVSSSSVKRRKKNHDSSKGWIWISVVFGTLLLLLMAAILYTQHQNIKKNNVVGLQNDDVITKNQNIDEASKSTSTETPNNPSQDVKICIS